MQVDCQGPLDYRRIYKTRLKTDRDVTNHLLNPCLALIIVDDASYTKVMESLNWYRGKMMLVYLPPYMQELNPIEI